VTPPGAAARGGSSGAAPKVGLFGGVGSGNIGNDATAEALLSYLRAGHPDAVVDAMCSGPEWVSSRYGIDAIPWQWYQKRERRASGVPAIALKALGKGIDAFRTALWVRRHDVVIVPGVGALEATMPQVRPWGTSYAMFLVCASGRLLGTRVALVNVGASPISQRLTRWLSTSAARLAFYRSYRDTMSSDAMRQRGLDTSHDDIYPDFVFSIPAPPYEPGDPQTVGLGVMDYYGTVDDRRQADALHASYVDNMKLFARWLVDSGRRVRLFVGDTNGSDDGVVQEILADLRESRPAVGPTRVVAESLSTYADLVQAMQEVGSVVAMRYHNVLCALRLCKPTISIGYSSKNDALMADMGLAEFCQSARSLDVGRLIEQFTEVESRSALVRQTLAVRNAASEQLLLRQFAKLSDLLFPAARTCPRRPALSLLARSAAEVGKRSRRSA
jgi:polysaccharide pyruvyl transferase WcaK-like protein